jgi:hypothetical protein
MMMHGLVLMMHGLVLVLVLILVRVRLWVQESFSYASS